jgi:hypothetical protein
MAMRSHEGMQLQQKKEPAERPSAGLMEATLLEEESQAHLDGAGKVGLGSNCAER